jgi:hypothetical protein
MNEFDLARIKKLDDLKIGALYIVQIDNPISKGLYMEYEDLKFIGVEDGNPTFIDQRVRPSSPYYNEPMFLKASNFESGESYSFSIYEQEGIKSEA